MKEKTAPDSINSQYASKQPEDALVRSREPAGVRQMFADIAPTYDLLNHLLSGGIDLWWRRIAARTLMKSQPGRVLDICTGTGDLALAVALEARKQRYAPLVVATDFTSAMVRLAVPKFQRFNRSHLPVVSLNPAAGDAMHLPFSDHTFDLVTVAFGIRNVTDLQAGLREMVRVTRPGGTVAILEFSHPKTPLLRWVYDFYFRHILPRIGRLLTGTRAYMYLPKSVANFPDTEEFAALLSSIAGTAARARRMTFGVATLYEAAVNHLEPAGHQGEKREPAGRK